MTTWPHERSLAEMNAFYGDPRSGKGIPNAAWYKENIVNLVPPYDMQFSWGPRVKSLPFHKKCKDAFGEALLAIKKLYGDQKTIEAHRLHLTGGSYNYRLMRGSANRLSIHSWGAALDIDPQHNPFPHEWTPSMMPLEAAACFQKCGIIWRGANHDIDPMHFQCALR